TLILFFSTPPPPTPTPFPTRRSSDLPLVSPPCSARRPVARRRGGGGDEQAPCSLPEQIRRSAITVRLTLRVTTHIFAVLGGGSRSEEHTSELQSRENLVCRLLLEKKK